MSPALRERLQTQVESHNVVLFMKGERHAPQCGFSAKVVQMLDTLVPDYATVNVLSDPEVREGIKEFSSWPTIPQLYAGGKFLGGCDIVTEMFEDGTLAETLGVEARTVDPPTITVTERAAAALSGATAGTSEVVRLGVSPSFEHELIIGAKTPGDVQALGSSVVIVLDPMSARRADGTKIDFIETPRGKAFKIDNPNAPPEVQQLSPEGLKELLDAATPLKLVDVRTPAERSICSLEGSVLLRDEIYEELVALERDTTFVFYCHHGIRSQQAAQHFLGRGFRRVYNLVGGIAAWSQRIDPSVPTY
jgi:monothiol glutaredoxin